MVQTIYYIPDRKDCIILGSLETFTQTSTGVMVKLNAC